MEGLLEICEVDSHKLGRFHKCHWYRRNEVTNHVIGFCDTNYARDLDCKRSLRGYIFTLGDNAISWLVMILFTISLSMTEAKYMTATKAIKEALWLRGLVSDLGISQKDFIMFCDNQNTIDLTKN